MKKTKPTKNSPRYQYGRSEDAAPTKTVRQSSGARHEEVSEAQAREIGRLSRRCVPAAPDEDEKVNEAAKEQPNAIWYGRSEDAAPTKAVRQSSGAEHEGSKRSTNGRG